MRAELADDPAEARSFDRTDLLPEVLTLAYGKKIALNLTSFGDAIKQRMMREAAAMVESQVEALLTNASWQIRFDDGVNAKGRRNARWATVRGTL